jgi:hypothetical protein
MQFGDSYHRRPGYRWGEIKMNVEEKGWKSVDYIHLAQDRGQWKALVNTVINLLFNKRRGIP